MILTLVILLIVAVLAMYCSKYSKPTAVVFTAINDKCAYSITIHDDRTVYARVKYAPDNIKVYDLHNVNSNIPFYDAVTELNANIKADAVGYVPIFLGMTYVVTTLDMRQEFSHCYDAIDFANAIVSTIL